MKNINIYYFDNEMGGFDKFNPRFIMEQKYTKQFLTYLSMHTPFSLTSEHFCKKFNINIKEFKKIEKLLYGIKAIKKDKNNFLALNFPFFNNHDINIIKKIVQFELDKNLYDYKISFENLKNSVLKNYPEIDYKQSFYHLICGKIFDGLMFEHLENKNILKQSFEKPDNRDYMITGYQNSKMCNNFNKKLYCSFNHAKYKQNSFSSFGNADGERVDFFRYFKLREINRLYGKFIDLDNLLSKYDKDEIVENCINIINDILCNKPVIKNEFYYGLELTSYIKNEIVQVPVFNNSNEKCKNILCDVIKELDEKICNSMICIIKKIEKQNLYAFQSNVNKDEIVNEIWHIFFGLLNNYLIKKHIVGKPISKKGQGKFLKCIYLVSKSTK